jgi:hypothetical protein
MSKGSNDFIISDKTSNNESIFGSGASTSSGSTFTTPIITTNTDQSTNDSTGSLILDGGAGIAKNVYIGGNLNVTGSITGGSTGSAFTTPITTTDTTQSTTINTGSLIVDGGAGIGKNLHVGGTIHGTNTADSSSGGTGSIFTNGGIGITKSLYVGGSGSTPATSTSTGAVVVASNGVGVTGTVYATAFNGPLTGAVTGDVTGNVTGSSGSCTGNATTATNFSNGTSSSSGGTVTATTFNVGNFVSATGSTAINGAASPLEINFYRAGDYERIEIILTMSLQTAGNITVQYKNGGAATNFTGFVSKVLRSTDVTDTSVTNVLAANADVGTTNGYTAVFRINIYPPPADTYGSSSVDRTAFDITGQYYYTGIGYTRVDAFGSAIFSSTTRTLVINTGGNIRGAYSIYYYS